MIKISKNLVFSYDTRPKIIAEVSGNHGGNKKRFLNSLNFFLRNNLISIISINRKNSIFHSRFNAKERIYEYKIINREGSLSLKKSKAWHVKTKLDISLLKKGAKVLEGKHDFSTFFEKQHCI